MKSNRRVEYALAEPPLVCTTSCLTSVVYLCDGSVSNLRRNEILSSNRCQAQALEIDVVPPLASIRTRHVWAVSGFRVAECAAAGFNINS